MNMPKFLAMLTQRGHEISSLEQVTDLFNKIAVEDDSPSDYYMETPHSTLRRMNFVCVAVNGLSTKCVSQLRTHAKRLTFLSTSTQYSAYTNHREDACLIPNVLEEHQARIANIYNYIMSEYEQLIADGCDKDKASYILPQGLRKTLIICGNIDDWQYVMKTRLCHRNSEETQYVMKLIYKAIKEELGEQWVKGMLPPCCTKEGCQEGKKSCGKKFDLEELLI